MHSTDLHQAYLQFIINLMYFPLLPYQWYQSYCGCNIDLQFVFIMIFRCGHCSWPSSFLLLSGCRSLLAAVELVRLDFFVMSQIRAYVLTVAILRAGVQCTMVHSQRSKSLFGNTWHCSPSVVAILAKKWKRSSFLTCVSIVIWWLEHAVFSFENASLSKWMKYTSKQCTQCTACKCTNWTLCRLQLLLLTQVTKQKVNMVTANWL